MIRSHFAVGVSKQGNMQKVSKNGVRREVSKNGVRRVVSLSEQVFA